MTVWMLTLGVDLGYCVLGVFSSREKADQGKLAAMENDNRIVRGGLGRIASILTVICVEVDQINFEGILEKDAER